MSKKLVAIAAIIIMTGTVTAEWIVPGTEIESDEGGKIMVGTYWRTTGDVGTAPGTHYIGTNDNVGFEIKVNGNRVMRMEPRGASGTPSIIGGHSANNVALDSYGTFIGGGGTSTYPNQILFGADYATIGGGIRNVGSDHYVFIGGGRNNEANDYCAVVGGGSGNIASYNYTTVAGGRDNSAGGYYAVVPGGYSNDASGYATVTAGGYDCTASGGYASVGGGSSNTADGFYATISGGRNNEADNNYSTIGGGYFNTTSGLYSTAAGGAVNEVSGSYATVSGGYGNSAGDAEVFIGGGRWNTASGQSSVIAGGYQNEATANFSAVCGGNLNDAFGEYSFVGGGDGNRASGAGSVVLGGMANYASDRYAIASGFRAKALHPGTFVWGDNSSADVSSTGNNQFIARATGGVYFYTNSALTTGAYLATGSGSWSSVSDRNVKENFSPVDGKEILSKVADLEISSWNYKSQNPDIRHIGPTAQDFHRAFGVGDDDKHLTTVDVDGVALAAIQALCKDNQAKDARIAELENQLEDLEARLQALENGSK